MFVREKKIKGKRYAYLVKAVYTKKGPRQKTIAYLGKAVKLKKADDSCFKSCFGRNDAKAANFLKQSSAKEICIRLIKSTLECYGLKEAADSKGTQMTTKVKDGELCVCLKKCSITLNKKKAALKLENGFMSSKSLTKLLRFRAKNSSVNDVAVKLAEAFVECPIDVPKEAFIAVFNKIYKKSRENIVIS